MPQIPRLTFENGALVSTDQVTVGDEFVNRIDVEARAKVALGENAAYLAQPAIPASPTLAQLTAATRIIRDQVDALTRQSNALIRLELADLEDVSDT